MTTDEERRELDALVTSMAVAEHRIRMLHKPEGWGDDMRCGICNCHGDRTWPCRTVKALEPWRWDVEGVRKEYGQSDG